MNEQKKERKRERREWKGTIDFKGFPMGYYCKSCSSVEKPHSPVMAFTTMSDTSGISSFTGTQSI